MIRQDIIEQFRIPPGRQIKLWDYHTGWAQTRELKALGKAVMLAAATAYLLIAFGFAMIYSRVF